MAIDNIMGRTCFVEKKCYICGRSFVPAQYHIYKRTVKGKVKWLCGYTCTCEYDRKHPVVKGNRWNK